MQKICYIKKWSRMLQKTLTDTPTHTHTHTHTHTYTHTHIEEK